MDGAQDHTSMGALIGNTCSSKLMMRPGFVEKLLCTVPGTNPFQSWSRSSNAVATFTNRPTTV